MDNKKFVHGTGALGLGLLASGFSSFLEVAPALGIATEFVRRFFNGLSTVAFGAAIFLLVRSQVSRR